MWLLMVNTKMIIVGAALLALAAPARVFGAAEAAGEVGRQLGSGISALGSVQIRPALAPEFAPRFAPEIDLPDIPGFDYSSLWSALGRTSGEEEHIDYDEPAGPPAPGVEPEITTSEEDDYIG
jgi:hypothetical protein